MWSSIVAFVKGSSSVVQLACLDFGIQWGLWAVSAALHTEKFYDLAGKLDGSDCHNCTHKHIYYHDAHALADGWDYK